MSEQVTGNTEVTFKNSGDGVKIIINVKSDNYDVIFSLVRDACTAEIVANEANLAFSVMSQGKGDIRLITAEDIPEIPAVYNDD